MTQKAFLEIGIGDRTIYASSLKTYNEAQEWLGQHADRYSLPQTLEDLDSVQLETLASIYPGDLPSGKPQSLIVGRLQIELERSAGLRKTRENFISLCIGDKGMSKNAPNKRLHYLGCPIHRIVKDFIAQGGDITRYDGSGGESIYGGKFNDEKEGFKIKPSRGSIAMANAGKNSNTSQFFVVLTSDPSQLKKLEGKYVAFGRVVDGLEILDRLNTVGTKEGVPLEDVWIDDCGLLPETI